LLNESPVTNAKRHTTRAPVLSPARTARRGRRAAIIESILRYLLRKGFVSTTLNDLAKAAGMSVSHLLYYFPNKEAVQQQLVTTVVTRILEEMNAYRFAPPEKRIELLADYLFGGGSIPPAYGAMALEQMALTMQDTKFRGQAKKMANALQGYLRDLFQGAPMAPGVSVADAAIIAGSLWMGLFINSYYYAPLTRLRARKIFCQELLELAGLDGKRRS